MISFKEYRQIRLAESTEHPMIEVDGVMRHRHNSLGQPIHPTDEGIRNFHRWFGDSKVVDEHGRPRLLYHGTNVEELSHFDFSKSRENGLVWATDSPKVASNFAIWRTTWNNANVIPVYVKSNFVKTIEGNYRNIRDVDSEVHELGTNEIDAYHIKNVRDPVSPNIDPVSDVWAIKKSSRIKSALGNSGAFSDKSDYINESIDHPMIKVDGALRHRNNSLGQPIHPTDEGIKNFHRWFGDSKIVDEHGRPKVVYHGTTKDFDEFDPNLAQSEGGAFYFSHSSLYRNPATNANTYASTNRKSIDGNVMPVYIKMSNPHFSGFSEKIPTDDDKISNWLNRMDKFNRSLDETKNSYYRQEIRYARKNKHDGVIFSNIEDDRYDKIGGFPDQTDVHAVFDANQIKSALGNSGNFSSRSNKITESTELNLKHFESSLKHKYPELQRLDLMHYGDDIKLDTIVVKKEHRNSGIGGNVLDDIKHYADKHDKRVILTAGVRDPHFGTTSHSRLDKFYRRHGFVSNKGRNKDYAITATHYYKKSNVVRKHPANI